MINVKDNIRIAIPDYPKLIIDILNKNGFDAYIVGGCVRDNILGKMPDDYDITTNAKPEEIKKLFKRTIDTGIKHGTVSVLFYENNKPLTYEVTTFRIDGEYADNRHPKDVVFVDNLREDLLRRDFTINAMAYNDEKGLVDIFGGVCDLNNKLIRAVGNPTERFTEDALRLLRAIRFSAKLGFDIEKETNNAIKKLAPRLESVSKERVEAELTKTITSMHPEYVSKIFNLGLSKYICKDFDSVKTGSFLPYLPTHLAYSCLFYYEDVYRAEEMLKSLRMDHNTIFMVKSLLEAKEFYGKIYRCKNDIDFTILIKELINLLKYDLTYDFIKLISINENDKKLIKKIKTTVDKFKIENCPIFTSDLKVNGNDVMRCGFTGKEIGMVLENLQKIVHKNRTYNDKEKLETIIKKVYNNYKGVTYEL